MNDLLDPKNDFVFKRIFGRDENKDVLLVFLNNTFIEAGEPPLTEILLMNPYTDKDVATEQTLSRFPAGLENIEDMYELSSYQSDMLEHYVAAPGEALAHESHVFFYEGTIDQDIFIDCWKQIVDRHSIFRTAFFHRNLLKPVEVIKKSVHLPIQVLDWRGMPAEEQDRMFANMFEKDKETDYDLHTAPLMRVSLINNSDTSFSFGGGFIICSWNNIVFHTSQEKIAIELRNKPFLAFFMRPLITLTTPSVRNSLKMET